MSAHNIFAIVVGVFIGIVVIISHCYVNSKIKKAEDSKATFDISDRNDN